MTKIAIPIRPHNLKEGMQQIEKASQADLVEIWADQIPTQDLNKLIEQKPKDQKIILNLKDPDEKGRFQGLLSERLQILEQYTNKVDYIDVPFRGEKTIPLSNPDKMILSYHNFEQTPVLSELQELVDEMNKHNPTIIKIATLINKETDLTNLFRLQVNNSKLKLIVIGMGELGVTTRTTAPMFKQPFTFASLDNKLTTAPGQLTAEDLKQEWSKLNLTDTS